jgi:hypothetical protein
MESALCAKRIFWLVISVVVYALQPGQGFSNGPTVGYNAGTIIPLHNTEIQLVYEHVRIILPSSLHDPGKTWCTYRLKNLSTSDARFTIAFVVSPATMPVPKASFRVSLDGTRVPTRIEPLDEIRWRLFVEPAPDSLPVWDVSIAAGDSETLEMDYVTSWSGTASDDDDPRMTMNFAYHAKSAALWAGLIREARISLFFDGIIGPMLHCAPERGECFSVNIHPDGYTTKNEGVHWVFSDWEPSEDFGIDIRVGWKEGSVVIEPPNHVLQPTAPRKVQR